VLGCQTQRPPGLYGAPKGIFGRIKKGLTAGVAGVENVYTRHVPLMTDVIDALTKTGTLSEQHYPSLNSAGRADRGSAEDGGRGGVVRSKVIVWIVGGTTYEESAHVATINASGSGVAVLLGGSCVHNSSSFLRELAVAPIR